MPQAIFTYRPNAQKTYGLFDEILTPEVLRDICHRITGQNQYQVIRDTSTYNKGRLLLLEWQGTRNYISLSETEIAGRNSSLQSVPTAINIFYADPSANKRLYYYFMPHVGNPFTDYHLFAYKLLMTAGVRFLNIGDYYHGNLQPYSNVDEIIQDRNDNQQSNSSNNSSYVSRTIDKIQIYAKVYGASKYESTLLALAVAHIADNPIDLYNICEQDLSQLPQSSLNTLGHIPNLTIHNTSLTFDRRQLFDSPERNELRSSVYTYNLFQRIGYKKCALCGCDIPQIIQGAHIWGVSEISHNVSLSDEEKFVHATNGHNGLWLCQNHHKLFDADILLFSPEGHLLVRDNVPHSSTEYLQTITTSHELPRNILSDNFRWYLSQHNALKTDIHCHRLFA